MQLSKEEIQNLSNLLLSQDDANTQVAFEIMKHNTFPKELITEVFGVFKITNNKNLKQQSKEMLEKHASKGVHDLMKRKFPIDGKGHYGATEKTIATNIKRYGWGNHINSYKLAIAIYNKYGAGANYLLTEGSLEQRKQFIKSIIKDGECSLPGKAFTKFPEVLFHFPELTSINLSRNKISTIPAGIKNFKNLKRLNMSNNKLKGMNPAILELKELEELDISNNKYKDKFPTHIFKLSALKKLNITNFLGHYHKTDFPEGIENLKQLQEFKLGATVYNYYPNFPIFEIITGSPVDTTNPLSLAWKAFQQGDRTSIGFILEHGSDAQKKETLDACYDSKSQKMDLSEIVLSKIPDSLLQYKIRDLNLYNCGIGLYFKEKKASNKKAIETDKKNTRILSQLTDLESLNLQSNQLADLVDLSPLKKLKNLDIGQNEFLEFPKQYTELNQLETLDLHLCTNYYHVSVKKEEILQALNNLKELKSLSIYFYNLIDKENTLFKKDLPALLPDCKINQ